ncbi:MAG: hypothetical protein HY043_04880 [Verrucomicrobia bacterium]|nr:hypothetical protein [Verrucomicrobiota bacterium]
MKFRRRLDEKKRNDRIEINPVVSAQKFWRSLFLLLVRIALLANLLFLRGIDAAFVRAVFALGDGLVAAGCFLLATVAGLLRFARIHAALVVAVFALGLGLHATARGHRAIAGHDGHGAPDRQQRFDELHFEPFFAVNFFDLNPTLIPASVQLRSYPLRSLI